VYLLELFEISRGFQNFHHPVSSVQTVLHVLTEMDILLCYVCTQTKGYK
jgi:hypothetical protein